MVTLLDKHSTPIADSGLRAFSVNGGYRQSLSGRAGRTQEEVPALVQLTAVILAKNSSRCLIRLLESLAWCDDVVVLDTGSTDDTRELAACMPGVRVHRLVGDFPGFGRARQIAIELAHHDWILSIDSDEVVSRALAEEITALILDPHTVYSLPFENYFNGRHITTCGWSPDRHERLFNRRMTGFCSSQVHERVQTRGLTVRHLRHTVLHFSYDSLDDFLRKMRTYAALFAEQNAGRKKSGPGKAVARGVWTFFKTYVMESGWRQGKEGLVISAYKAQTTFWKYLLLHEANRRLCA